MTCKRVICILIVFLSVVLYAETFEEVIQRAEIAISNKYKTPIAKKSAEKKLLAIVENSNLTDDEKIEKIKKQFLFEKQNSQISQKTQDFQLSSDYKTLVKCNNRDITECIIPDGVTKISYSAFAGCLKLQSVIIPNSVKTIENSAFMRCYSLQSVVIPNSVTKIGIAAFWGCHNLQSVTIPDSVDTIGDLAFMCVKNVDISLSNPYFYKDSVGALISKKDKKLIWFPPEYHGSYTVPDSVTVIGRGAFSSCGNLQKVTIPDSVTRIEAEAFMNSKNLQSVSIPNSVMTIGNSAFSGCYNLQSMIIPDGVTMIGFGAFFGCENLQSMTVSDSVKTISECAFAGVKDVNISSSHPYYYKDSKGALICKKDNSLIWFPPEYSGSYTIPNGVTMIGHSAFRFCKNLRSVIIPASVTTIKDFAFDKCDNLKKIRVPRDCKISERLFPKDCKIIRY